MQDRWSRWSIIVLLFFTSKSETLELLTLPRALEGLGLNSKRRQYSCRDFMPDEGHGAMSSTLCA